VCVRPQKGGGPRPAESCWAVAPGAAGGGSPSAMRHVMPPGERCGWRRPAAWRSRHGPWRETARSWGRGETFARRPAALVSRTWPRLVVDGRGRSGSTVLATWFARPTRLTTWHRGLPWGVAAPRPAQGAHTGWLPELARTCCPGSGLARGRRLALGRLRQATGTWNKPRGPGKQLRRHDQASSGQVAQAHARGSPGHTRSPHGQEGAVPGADPARWSRRLASLGLVESIRHRRRRWRRSASERGSGRGRRCERTTGTQATRHRGQGSPAACRPGGTGDWGGSRCVKP